MKGPILTFTFRSYAWWMGFTQLITLIKWSYFTLLTTGFVGPHFVLCFLSVFCFLFFEIPLNKQQTKPSEKKSDDSTWPSHLGKNLVKLDRRFSAANQKPFCRIQVFPSSAPTADGAVAILKMPPGGSTIWVFSRVKTVRGGVCIWTKKSEDVTSTYIYIYIRISIYDLYICINTCIYI